MSLNLGIMFVCDKKKPIILTMIAKHIILKSFKCPKRVLKFYCWEGQGSHLWKTWTSKMAINDEAHLKLDGLVISSCLEFKHVLL
jgi:hypothetical protein